MIAVGFQPVLAASFESLIIFVVILLLSAVANWVKTRKGLGPEGPEGWDEDSPVPPAVPRQRPGPGEQPVPPARPKPVFDLEGELRRLFGEEVVPKPAPPPVLPRPVTEPEAADEYVPVVLAPAPKTPARGGRALEAAAATAGESTGLASSAAAYLRSGGMTRVGADTAAAAQAFRSASHPAASRDQRREASPEVASVLALLREPASARQAIVASVILSSPKGLAPGAGAPGP